MSVVLPAPFGPHSASDWPASIENDTPFNASTRP